MSQLPQTPWMGRMPSQPLLIANKIQQAGLKIRETHRDQKLKTV